MKYQCKKVVSMLLVIMMAISLVPVASVEGAVESLIGEWEYDINRDGNIKITGYNGDETNIIIPSEIDGKSVTEIGDGLFFDCKITSITIPKSVRFMSTTWLNGAGIFSYCDRLESINVNSENPVYSSQNGILYSKDKSVLWAYPHGKSEDSFIIPDGVEYLAKDAFLHCKQLKKITIPNSVTAIGNNVFGGCIGLTDINIPNSMESIGHNAFGGCSGLSTIIIPNSIIEIGDYAFSGCSGLESMTIPDSVTLMGKRAFSNCINLKKIMFMGKKPECWSEERWDRKPVFDETLFRNTHKDFIMYYPIWDEKNWRDYTYYMKRPHCDSGILVENITIDKSELRIEKNKQYQLKETVTPADATNTNVTWLSFDPEVATVSESGRVTAKGKGKCTILAVTDDGNKIASCQVTVTVPVTEVMLNREKLVLKKGKKYTLKAKVIPKDVTTEDVFWRSSNKKVATVSKNGVVKARKKGKCTITVVTKAGNKIASCQVTVTVPVTKVTLNRKKIVMKKGTQYTLKAKVMLKNATIKKVSWRSSNKKVATVSKKGVIEARKEGGCTITVITKNGNKKAKCRVIVK